MSAKKILTWIAVSSAESALLYYGVFERIAWCWNLLRFSLWALMAVTITASFVLSSKVKDSDFAEYSKSFSRSVPGWVSAAFDCAIAGTLAAFGHFGYAANVLTQQLFEANIFSTVEKARAKETA